MRTLTELLNIPLLDMTREEQQAVVRDLRDEQALLDQHRQQSPKVGGVYSTATLDYLRSLTVGALVWLFNKDGTDGEGAFILGEVTQPWRDSARHLRVRLGEHGIICIGADGLSRPITELGFFRAGPPRTFEAGHWTVVVAERRDKSGDADVAARLHRPGRMFDR